LGFGSAFLCGSGDAFREPSQVQTLCFRIQGGFSGRAVRGNPGRLFLRRGFLSKGEEGWQEEERPEEVEKEVVPNRQVWHPTKEEGANSC